MDWLVTPSPPAQSLILKQPFEMDAVPLLNLLGNTHGVLLGSNLAWPGCVENLERVSSFYVPSLSGELHGPSGGPRKERALMPCSEDWLFPVSLCISSQNSIQHCPGAAGLPRLVPQPPVTLNRSSRNPVSARPVCSSQPGTPWLVCASSRES